MDIPVLFEDDSLMVIEKPPGLVVDASETQKTGTLQEILEKDFKINLDRGGIVHRLDKDTSGLMIIAKTQAALETLQLQFKERMVKKEYLALVHGVMEKEVTVSGSIGRNPKNRQKFTVLAEGKEAETKFIPRKGYQLPAVRLQSIFSDQKTKNQKRKMERSDYGKFTLVACLPLTGRTHQIRVHLKYANFPLVGDEKYGGRKTAKWDKRWCPRQFLHAARLQFYHPVSGERLSFESNLPNDLQEVLNKLELTN